MTSINLSEFILLTPNLDRLYALSVTVMPDGRLHLNGKLIEKLNGPFIFFRYHRDGKQILIETLEEHQDGAYRLPKSGDIRGIELSRTLVALGFKLPAYYSVTWNEEACMWYGIYRPEKTQLNDKSKQKKMSQPRKNGLKDMVAG